MACFTCSNSGNSIQPQFVFPTSWEAIAPYLQNITITGGGLLLAALFSSISGKAKWVGVLAGAGVSVFGMAGILMQSGDIQTQALEVYVTAAGLPVDDATVSIRGPSVDTQTTCGAPIPIGCKMCLPISPTGLARFCDIPSGNYDINVYHTTYGSVALESQTVSATGVTKVLISLI